MVFSDPEPFFYIITVSLVVALWNFNKFRNTKNIYFIYFILFTFIIDKLSYINRNIQFITFKDTGEVNNNPIINFYVILAFIFSILFYRIHFKNKKIKKLINYFLFLYLAFVFYELSYIKKDFLNTFLAEIVVFGSILFSIILLMFLIEMIKNRKIINNIEKSFIFWVSIGCLLFYLGIIPIMVILDSLQFDRIFKTIFVILNIVTHSCFVIGYIWSNKKYNY